VSEPLNLDVWREKLAYFQNQEAITADPDQKFAIACKIRDVQLAISQASQAGLLSGELGLQAADETLMDAYFAECAKHDPSFFQSHADGQTEPRQQFLIAKGLAFQSPNGGVALTDEGILFCALRELIPSLCFHVHVQLQWQGGNQEHVWGSVLYLHKEVLQRLDPLSARVMGNPKSRNEFGGEAAISEYPRVAIVEALTNFLIHRDYCEDDHGRIGSPQSLVAE